ncbi:MAG: ATP-dependent DNA ligase [Planctomycetota bacterium]
MHRFAALITALDETNKTNAKLAALVDYFSDATPADAAWAVHFLSGRKLNRLVKSGDLRAWAAEEAGVAEWLFEESYTLVGDLAETIALLLPAPTESTDVPLARVVEEGLFGLRRAQGDDAKRDLLLAHWRRMDRPQRFVFNKLLTGGFRIGVSQRSVTKAIATVAGLDPALVAHRLMGDWDPTPTFYESLVADEDDGELDDSRPYPFFLAHAVEPEEGPAPLGDPSEFLIDWKWDGIRAQVIRRSGKSYIWSRGEELIGEKFPEIEAVADALPDGTVLDGELVARKDGVVLPFGELQRRLNRKSVGKKLLKDVPGHLIAFDILEAGGEDVRSRPLTERRRRLVTLLEERAIDPSRLSLSETIEETSWDSLAAVRETSRERRAEGLMLKRRDEPYGVGRVRGPWWKWKVDPFTVDAVMIYAQAGHGRRANLYTDYTFAAWRTGEGGEDELVPFAKAYSGLTDEEIGEVDRWVRRNTLERFGPVRSVKAELVFELAFEDIRRSTRHKSGIAVRFPRIARWRKDKPAAEADRLDTIVDLLPDDR